MLIFWPAIKELLARYAQVFGSAWEIRHQLDGPQRDKDAIAFLPAQLELIEKPSHPAPTWTMRFIIAFALLALLWSFFGRLDIVATARGKLIPGVKVKVVQSLDTGVVRNILVENGQRVQSGQPLIELDTTQARADADKAHVVRADAAQTVARAQALLDALEHNRQPIVRPLDGDSIEKDRETQRFADGLYAEYNGKLAVNRAELAKRQAEFDTARHQVDKLLQTVPLAKQSAEAYRDLVKQQYVSRQDYLDKEQARIQQEQDLAAQKSHARELRAGIEEQQSSLAAISAQFRREQLDILNQAQRQLDQYAQEETKADQRQSRLVLRAPTGGIVQQLNVHTIGGVITQAQALMEIVPDDTLEVEASVENKDIGFISLTQDAVVKIDAFPYSRYGYLNGKVSKVSNNAAPDRKMGLVFPVIIKLPANRLRIEDKWVNLSPGMAVTVEIKTGRRRVVEYFLSPLLETGQESLRER